MGKKEEQMQTMESKPSSPLATPPSSSGILNRLIDLDTAWSLQIHTLCLPVPRSVLKALEISGDGRFWFPIPIALLPLSSSSSSSGVNHHSLLLGLLLGSLLDLLLVGLVKYLVKRPRPVYNKDMHLTVSVDHWSFPSGHSSRVFFIASFLYLSSASLCLAGLAHRWIPDRYNGEAMELLMLLVFLWSSATSVSRVLLGRHFVFDVIAGACLGVFEALFVSYFFRF